jgi:hypothetical protein
MAKSIKGDTSQEFILILYIAMMRSQKKEEMTNPYKRQRWWMANPEIMLPSNLAFGLSN